MFRGTLVWGGADQVAGIGGGLECAQDRFGTPSYDMSPLSTCETVHVGSTVTRMGVTNSGVVTRAGLESRAAGRHPHTEGVWPAR